MSDLLRRLLPNLNSRSDHMGGYSARSGRTLGGITGGLLRKHFWLLLFNFARRLISRSPTREESGYRGVLHRVGISAEQYFWRRRNSAGASLAEAQRRKSTRVSERLNVVQTMADQLLAADIPIICFDVGALGGVPAHWNYVRTLLRCILFEPNEDEARRLRRALTRDDLLIPSALWSSDCKLTLHVTRKLGSSSIYEPISTRDPRRDVIDRRAVEARSLASWIAETSLNPDVLKVDAQGSELEVLRGLRAYRPLAMRIEYSTRQMYVGQPLAEEIESLVVRSYGYTRVFPSADSRLEGHGDAVYIRTRDLNERENRICSLCHWLALDPRQALS